MVFQTFKPFLKRSKSTVWQHKPKNIFFLFKIFSKLFHKKMNEQILYYEYLFSGINGGKL